MAVLFGLVPIVLVIEGVAFQVLLYFAYGRPWVESTIPWVLDLARVPYLVSTATFGLLALLYAVDARRSTDLPRPGRSTGVAGIILGSIHLLNVAWGQVTYILLPFTG